MCFIEAYLFEPQMLFKIFQYRNTTQMTELIIHENILQVSNHQPQVKERILHYQESKGLINKNHQRK